MLNEPDPIDTDGEIKYTDGAGQPANDDDDDDEDDRADLSRQPNDKIPLVPSNRDSMPSKVA